MTTFQLIETIVLCLVIIALAVYYVYKAIKNKWLENISDTIDKAIREAEDMAKNGELEKVFKKQFVLNKVKQKCEELGIPYTLLEKLIQKLIDKIVKDHNIFVK